jgi:uncharacterized protein
MPLSGGLEQRERGLVDKRAARPSLLPVKYAALCITHKCNLRCTYCYVGHDSSASMSKDTARRALDFLHRNSSDGCVATLFGGEPLLEFELIRAIVSYSRGQCGYNIDFRLSTNGTCLNSKRLEFLRTNGIYFVVSIDGTKAQHDANRMTASGCGSYGLIERSLRDVLAANPYTIAVSVVAPNTVNDVHVGVKHLFDQGLRYVLQTLDYSAQWGRSELRALRAQYQALAGEYEGMLEKGRKIYYSPFDERIKTHAQKRYGKGDLCDLANTQIAIAPSGRVYPCVQFIGNDGPENAVNSIGDVFNGFDEESRRRFVELNYRDKDCCAGCAHEGRCATYCGCVNWRCTGRVDQVPAIVCEHERMLLPIVDRLANRLWRNNSALFKRKFYEKTFPVSSYIEDCLVQRGSPHVATEAS